MGDPFTILEARYCPPLDPALLSAILSDYDLGDQTSLESATRTLDELKESALLEEAVGSFDPSGTGAPDEDAVSDMRPESCPDTSASLSHDTDLTSLSNGVSSLDLDYDLRDNAPTVGDVGEAEDLEKLDDDTKIELLQDIFGNSVSQYSIEYTMRKCNGKWNSAMEELLNQVYFGEVQSTEDGEFIKAKGIDAFSEDNVARRRRKDKAKKRRSKNMNRRRSSSLPAFHDGSAIPTTNKWKSAAEDIEFISTHTGVATATVSSVYYEKGASVPQTISALLKASMEESKHVATDDAVVSTHARELGHDFPTIAPDYLTALIRLTHPSTAAAHELAKALTSKPKAPNGGGVQIIPHYVTGNVDFEADWNTVSKKTKSSTSRGSPSSDVPFSAARSDAYAIARATAFSQASAAHRKAKSDRLMGGAAAYYGQVGREYAALSSSASAAAADELAATQSTSTQLDLHGVDVANAVRIASEKVHMWWESLGEGRVNGRIGAEDRQMGYKIVVGLGRHSEGGKGKLGPAVVKKLRQEGWRVEPAAAVLVVKGPMRR